MGRGSSRGHHVPAEGIRLSAAMGAEVVPARERFAQRLAELGLDHATTVKPVQTPEGTVSQFCLTDHWLASWAPGHDTLGIAQRLGLDTFGDAEDLEREILVAMLCSPVAFSFPGHDELASHVRMRMGIVQAARKTALAFTTEAAERPEDYWRYEEDTGFTLIPGQSLVDALRKATQPEVSGKLYSFSCYRATEYVIMLAVAQELTRVNPALHDALQSHCERKAIRSGPFHDVFLYEYGSMEKPLPPRYYVPGDRLWFRNPDEPSADVAGFEGSWVFYEGGGLFSNFWKRDAPFTMVTKCLEIHHWRHGLRAGEAGGEAWMDEEEVARRVAQTLTDPQEVERILARMQRLREPKGVYVDGGCIDTSREYPRLVRPASATIQLPPLG